MSENMEDREEAEAEPGKAEESLEEDEDRKPTDLEEEEKFEDHDEPVVNRWRSEDAVSVAMELLREGREIQKISVIRNLPEIMQAHPEECSANVLPLIQVLQQSDSLDLHCEGAIAYKNIITDKSLLEIDVNISEEVLKGALANFSYAPEDSYPYAAWIETLLEIADNLTDESFSEEILPVAIAQSQQNKPVKSRIAATKLFEKLAARLSANEVKASVLPSIQSLCQDVTAQVRASVCERLPAIAKTLNCVEYKMVVLPLLVELCNDEDLGVQERALESIRFSLPYFDKETVRNVVVPLFKRSAERAMQICDMSLAVISKNLGPWCFQIKDVITEEQKSWFLTFFARMAQLGTSQSVGSNLDLMTRSDPEGLSFSNPFDSDPVQVACRDWCAYNFPGMIQMFGAEAFRTNLLPAFAKLCQDSEEGIRKTIAAGFHEVVKLLENTPCVDNLVSSFIDIIRLGDPDVVGKLTANLGSILPVFYAHFKQAATSSDAKNEQTDSNGNFIQRQTQLNRILLAHNRLVRNNSNWRAHENYLREISCLITCLDSFDDVQMTFLPLLKEEILTSRAVPCRIAAARTLLIFMRHAKSKRSRISIIEFFIQTLGHHQSCHKRSLFLDVCREVLDLYSRYFFKKYFFAEAIKLLDDKVSNVRIKASKLLPLMKKTIILPLDEPLLAAMENSVKKLLEKDLTPREMQAAQMTASELSLAETGEIENKIDRKKLSEEFERFGSPELVASCHEFNSTNQRQPSRPPTSAITKPPPAPQSKSAEDSSSSLLPPPGGVRIRKPRTAIVRPQPKVVVTRSPSPRPEKDGEINSPEKEIPPTPPPGKRMVQSASESDFRSSNHRRVENLQRSTLIRPPTPINSRRSSASTESRQNDSPRPYSSRTRTYRSAGSVRQAAQKWEATPSSRVSTPISFDQNGNNNPRYNSTVASNNGSSVQDSGGSSNFSPRSSIPIASYIRRGSLPGNNFNNGNSDHKRTISSESQEKTNLSSPRKSYGLMKVQSASAIQQSSASFVSMRARRKF